jgi:hypothetical protein
MHWCICGFEPCLVHSVCAASLYRVNSLVTKIWWICEVWRKVVIVWRVTLLLTSFLQFPKIEYWLCRRFRCQWRDSRNFLSLRRRLARRYWQSKIPMVKVGSLASNMIWRGKMRWWRMLTCELSLRVSTTSFQTLDTVYFFLCYFAMS